MTNKSFGDSVASEMDSLISSDAYRSIFARPQQIKTASKKLNCKEDHDHKDDCYDANDVNDAIDMVKAPMDLGQLKSRLNQMDTGAFHGASPSGIASKVVDAIINGDQVSDEQINAAIQELYAVYVAGNANLGFSEQDLHDATSLLKSHLHPQTIGVQACLEAMLSISEELEEWGFEKSASMAIVAAEALISEAAKKKPAKKDKKEEDKKEDKKDKKDKKDDKKNGKKFPFFMKGKGKKEDKEEKEDKKKSK